MRPEHKRALKILTYMMFYGAVYGIISGAVSGAIAGLFLFAVGAVYGVIFGAFFGVQIGAVVGLVCGFITVWFDADSRALMRTYRRSVSFIAIMLTLLLVYVRIEIFYMQALAGNAGVSFILVMLTGAMFAFYFSRKLSSLYYDRFLIDSAPTS